MNVGIIFAGGTGQRMNTKDKPKQFLMVHGKPIIVHTIEVFEKHKDIDGIIVVCLKEWIPYMKEIKFRYRLNKIKKIVQGGKTGQLSIYNGLKAANEIYDSNETIVLIHDGVRPLIDEELLTKNINCVKKNGSAITCSTTKETFVIVDENSKIINIPKRDDSKMAKAPQSFYLKDILKNHEKALELGLTNMIDSCTLMSYFNYDLSIVEGNYQNIKITTPDDFYMFRAIYDVKENEQLL